MAQPEIVVLGAGVAGLLLASELAAHHDVLVLEKASAVPDTKYWLTDRGSVDANPELASALDTEYREMAFTAYEGTSYLARGEYWLWHSERLLTSLTERLAHRNGRIEFGQRFYSLSTGRDKATVYANDRRFDCRLIIDCMGVASPIIYARNVVDVLGFYLLYGATFRMRKPLVPVALHNLMLSHQPGWIEAFPTADGRLHIVLIVPTAKLRPASDLKADFTFITTKSPYGAHIEPDPRERRFLGGIVPVARMRRRALDRVFFFGEAGQVNPAASATALTRMLYNHRAVAAHLTACLRANTLTGRELAADALPLVGAFNQQIQRELFRSILGWNSDDYLRIVRELIALDDSAFANHLIFGDLPESWTTMSRYAARLWRKRSVGLLTALFRGLLAPVIRRTS
jgi:2-polyprenyl-6-methoxyphenol hydroxylase-like FAD-dependent oxidoreductase